VRRRLTSWTRPLAASLALVVGLTFVTPPAAMADGAKAPASVSTPSRLAATTALKLATLAPTSRAFAQTPATADASGTTDSGRSFLSTPTGIAAVVLMVAGAGFVAYRIHKDNAKVHSPIR
jgi:hypothetical protein